MTQCVDYRFAVGSRYTRTLIRIVAVVYNTLLVGDVGVTGLGCFDMIPSGICG